MTSTHVAATPDPLPDWQAAGLSYYSLGHYLKRTFGGRVWKVSVDAGFDCPNRDGTVGRGGCVFCDPSSFSPSRRLKLARIADQIAEGVRRLRQRHQVDRFLAYFQPATNTYAPVDRLRQLYNEALDQPGVVGLIVGTRPDCAPDEVLDLLAELARRTWVSIEFGLQTIHEESLQWMNRGHTAEVFFQAVRRAQQRGLRVGAHVILGLPHEGEAERQATARALAECRLNSLKLHNLLAVKNTALADMVLAGQVKLPELDDYARWVVDFLELTPPDCVIDRLVGDAFADTLLAPEWCANKSAALSRIDQEFARRGTWQGKHSPQRGGDI